MPRHSPKMTLCLQLPRYTAFPLCACINRSALAWQDNSLAVSVRSLLSLASRSASTDASIRILLS